MLLIKQTIYLWITIKAHIMATILYPSPIVGPIHSRRLGISLGVNVNPSDGKICTFDCIYCEVGYNRLRRPTLPQPSRELIAERLEQKLKEMRGGLEARRHHLLWQRRTDSASRLPAYNRGHNTSARRLLSRGARVGAHQFYAGAPPRCASRADARRQQHHEARHGLR